MSFKDAEYAFRRRAMAHLRSGGTPLQLSDGQSFDADRCCDGGRAETVPDSRISKALAAERFPPHRRVGCGKQ